MRYRRWLLLTAWLLLAAGLGWWVVQVTLLDSSERSNASGYGQFVLAVVGLLIIVGDGSSSRSVVPRRTWTTWPINSPKP